MRKSTFPIFSKKKEISAAGVEGRIFQPEIIRDGYIGKQTTRACSLFQLVFDRRKRASCDMEAFRRKKRQ